MKKKILTLVAMATLVTMMTACGNSETVDNTTIPTTTPTVTVEPTEAPEVTAEPTEVPEVTPTETPVEPEVAPTEAPEVTVEPTVAPVEPTEVPEITEAPVEETTEEPAGNPADVAEDPNFEEIKNMVKKHISRGKEDKYSDIEAIIETMDETRYEVTAVDTIDIVLDDPNSPYKENYERYFMEGERFKVYSVWDDTKADFVDYATTFTGEFYFMTLTDLVTGESFVWGLRAHLEHVDNPGTYHVAEYSLGVLRGLFSDSSLKEFYK